MSSGIILVLLSYLLATSLGQLLSVTYPGLGTFNRNDFYDLLHRPLLYLPSSPSRLNPTFHLFTRSNRDSEDQLDFNSTESLQNSHFKKDKPTKILIHGWMASYDSPDSFIQMKDALLEYEDFNVILVDWSKGSKTTLGNAAVNTRVVGAMVGVQIRMICNEFNLSPSDFHIIGHSYGAHVAGYAGKFLGNSTLGQITGLDPGNPFFTGIVPEGRLWPSDAQFVDVMHTDAIRFLDFGWGMLETCGHVDIFPNGGYNQPGCPLEAVTFFWDKPGNWANNLAFCGHTRALKLYTESWNSSLPLLKAYQCDSYQDFTAGKCLDCGQEGCVLMGPRTIEYRKHVNESFKGSTDGPKWFLVTDRHVPLLRKYQILIQTGGNSSFLTALTDKINLLSLKFTDKSGNSENLKIDGKSVLSNLLKRNGSFAGVLGLDPVQVDSIELNCPRSVLENKLSAIKLNLESLVLVGLTSLESTVDSAAKQIRFCNRNPEFSIAELFKKVKFERC